MTFPSDTENLWKEYESMNRSIVTHRPPLLLLAGVALVALTGLAWERLPTTLLKSGSTLRGSFREVVVPARRYTVRFVDDGRSLAYGAIVRNDQTHGVVAVTKASEVGASGRCVLFDGTEVEARRVAQSAELDLAIYHLEGKDLPVEVVQWGDPPTTRGTWLVSPGVSPTPLGVGILSVPERPIARRIGFLGIRVAERDTSIVQVIEDSAAEASGIRVGDVVTHVGAQRVTTPRQLVAAIREYRPDEPVPFTITRGEQTIKIRAVLGEEEEPPTGNRDTSDFSRRRSGFPRAFQHDTPLQPEHCGGVVVDLTGTAVGLNIARQGRTGSLAISPKLVNAYVKWALQD